MSLSEVITNPHQSDLSLKKKNFTSTVHISSCGRHLAVIRHTRTLLLLRDFERLLRGEVSITDSAMTVNLGSVLYPSNYLAVSGGRVAVAMVSFYPYGSCLHVSSPRHRVRAYL
jgi:hypothetical protein